MTLSEYTIDGVIDTPGGEMKIRGFAIAKTPAELDTIRTIAQHAGFRAYLDTELSDAPPSSVRQLVWGEGKE